MKIYKKLKEKFFFSKSKIPQPVTNFMNNNNNNNIPRNLFPDKIKVADVVSVFKKEDPHDKANRWLMRFSPIISKKEFFMVEMKIVLKKFFP